ncbi:MAG TPA: NlpC/P60 family protein [Variovorax sp.]|nr:NlpC/P60 family protein [Variovorax sp.]
MTHHDINAEAPTGAFVVSGADVVAEARSWMAVKWRHQGRSREGVDCAGLVIKVAHELGLTEFDTADYSRQATDETMLELCREHLVEIVHAAAEPGDVAVMRFGANRHIGFFGDYPHGGLTLIHAYSSPPRRVVEHRFNDDWLRMNRAQLIGIFRFPGIA